MAQTWQDSYEELKKFIAANPEIEIEKNSVVIMGDIRPEFYKLFDAVRAGFVKERFAGELEKGYALGRAYAEASKTLKEDMRLEEIQISASTNWLLLDPVNGLMRVLFDPLFDLLKGKTDLAAFISTAHAAVADSFKMLFRDGYERWSVLALIKQLAPYSLWSGHAYDFYNDPSVEGQVTEGIREDYVDEPVESKKLVYEEHVRASYVVPGPIIQSGRLGAYVGLRLHWYAPHWKARVWNERLEWINLRQLFKEFGTGDLWPDMMVYVTDERPADIKLIADFVRLARPDIIIEFMEEDDWYDAKRVAALTLHNIVLSPRLGSYVISRVEVPPEAFKPLEAVPMAVPAPPTAALSHEPVAAVLTPAVSEAPVTGTEGATPPPPPPPPMARPLSLAELPADVHVLSVGYDMSKLDPIVSALTQVTAMIREARMKELELGQSQG